MSEQRFYVGLKHYGNGSAAPNALFITRIREDAIKRIQEYLQIEKETFSKTYTYAGEDCKWDMWYCNQDNDLYCIEDGVELYEPDNSNTATHSSG